MAFSRIFLVSITLLCGLHSLHAGSANFDGVGGDDLSIYDPVRGTWYILSTTGDLLAFDRKWGWGSAVPAPWDYDKDGITDLAVYSQGSGKWFILSAATGDLIVADLKWGGRSMISVPGDYNGDGIGDLAVYQPGSGNWFILSLDGELLAFNLNWGGEGMVPVEGDFNGDGATDLAVYHRATGNWFIRSLDGQVILEDQNWGNRDMYPVPGDYDGDGTDDLAVYHQPTGKWFIRAVDGTQIATKLKWGWASAQPVSGDFNGDGTDDLAVYHRPSAKWYIRTVDNALIAFDLPWGIRNRSTPSQTYAKRSTAGKSIICLGDSITFGRGGASNGPRTAYPALLEQKLNQHFGGLFRCINAGVPGERTSGGAARLPNVLNTNRHAQVLLLMQGTNDALTDQIFLNTDNNLRYMLSVSAQRGLATFLSTVPPVVPSTSFRSQQASRIRRFNSYIPGIAAPTRTRIVNTFNYLYFKPNWTSYYRDVNHPNDAGYLLVRDAFFDAISNAYRSGALK